MTRFGGCKGFPPHSDPLPQGRGGYNPPCPSLEKWGKDGIEGLTGTGWRVKNPCCPGSRWRVGQLRRLESLRYRECLSGERLKSPVAALEKSGKKAPLGAKKNRDEGLTGRGSWVIKTGAAGGGKLTKNKPSSHKDLDSGAKVDIILSSKTCSLKTK